ncbi:hypothetical protein IP91_03144 [Pseudoduganella lurida]|uniref:Uncharacterized protein n=1 Tax=Pseudoduganella lurida TaxID=1036180 RepID=A0A562R742_9BURK|nr:hypothetical protein [Pseudoduganella lurida]TWI64374.1 hypothetical protein IP91_03144 [Pseudoduganella lurida]
MSHVDEFLKRDKKGHGKLAPWLDDIVKLRKKGASYRAVCRYLAECGVTATPAEVHAYMHRCGRNKLTIARSPAPSPISDTPGASIGPDGLPEFKWNPRADPNSSW